MFFLIIFFNKIYIFGLPTKDDLGLNLITLMFDDKHLKTEHITQDSLETYLNDNLFIISKNLSLNELISLSQDKPVFVYNVLDESNGLFSWYDTEYKGLLDKNIFLVLDKANTDIVLLDSNKKQIYIDESLFLDAWQRSSFSAVYLEKVSMDVPSYSQLKLGYITGCEFVAVGMMINYKLEDDITVNDISSNSPRNINPNYGYRGNPKSDGGFSIFPNALLHMTKNYLGNSIDLTGTNLIDLKRHLSLKTPVVAWVTNCYKKFN